MATVGCQKGDPEFPIRAQTLSSIMRDDPAFKDDILAPMENLGVDQIASASVMIKARTKTKPIQQWRVAREYHRRLKNLFDDRSERPLVKGAFGTQ